MIEEMIALLKTVRVLMQTVDQLLTGKGQSPVFKEEYVHFDQMIAKLNRRIGEPDLPVAN